jgi:hypothetical protein
MSSASAHNLFDASVDHVFDNDLPDHVSIVAMDDPRMGTVLGREITAGRAVMLVDDTRRKLVEPVVVPFPVRLLERLFRHDRLRVAVTDLTPRQPATMRISHRASISKKKQFVDAGDTRSLTHC